MADKRYRQFDSALEVQIATILEQSGFEYVRSPEIGGLQLDFIATGPNGATVVIEAKGWHGDNAHLERAQRQAQSYRIATGAEAALVVLATAPPTETPTGVIGLDHLASWLWHLGYDMESEVQRQQHSSPEIAVTSPTVFAAMPFSAQYDDVYLVAMSHAAQQIGATCVRVDREDFVGDIVAEIRRLIDSSIAVIADLSEARPNVMYEVGYAHALGRPTVHICSTPMSELPFDIAHDNTLAYTAGQTSALRERLAQRLKAAIDARAV